MAKYEKSWLLYPQVSGLASWKNRFKAVYSKISGKCVDNTIKELKLAVTGIIGGNEPRTCTLVDITPSDGIVLEYYANINKAKTGCDNFEPGEEGYVVFYDNDINSVVIAGDTDRGIMYGAFAFIRQLQNAASPDKVSLSEKPDIPFRMLDHWDNMKGDIERGYSGNSFFYEDYRIIIDDRTEFYARMMA